MKRVPFLLQSLVLAIMLIQSVAHASLEGNWIELYAKPLYDNNKTTLIIASAAIVTYAYYSYQQQEKVTTNNQYITPRSKKVFTTPIKDKNSTSINPAIRNNTPKVLKVPGTRSFLRLIGINLEPTTTQQIENNTPAQQAPANLAQSQDSQAVPDLEMMNTKLKTMQKTFAETCQSLSNSLLQQSKKLQTNTQSAAQITRRFLGCFIGYNLKNRQEEEKEKEEQENKQMAIEDALSTQEQHTRARNKNTRTIQEQHTRARNKNTRTITFTSGINDAKKAKVYGKGKWYEQIFTPSKFTITINGQILSDSQKITIPIENNQFIVRRDYTFMSFEGYREFTFKLDAHSDECSIDFEWDSQENVQAIEHGKTVEVPLQFKIRNAKYVEGHLHEPGREYA